MRAVWNKFSVKIMKIYCFLTVNLIKFPLIFTARDSADIWGGSRVFLVTDLPNSTIDVEKLYTSFADRGLGDRLVIVQRGQDGRFINSHGSFKTLSRAQERQESLCFFLLF